MSGPAPSSFASQYGKWDSLDVSDSDEDEDEDLLAHDGVSASLKGLLGQEEATAAPSPPPSSSSSSAEDGDFEPDEELQAFVDQFSSFDPIVAYVVQDEAEQAAAPRRFCAPGAELSGALPLTPNAALRDRGRKAAAVARIP